MLWNRCWEIDFYKLSLSTNTIFRANDILYCSYLYFSLFQERKRELSDLEDIVYDRLIRTAYIQKKN